MRVPQSTIFWGVVAVSGSLLLHAVLVWWEPWFWEAPNQEPPSRVLVLELAPAKEAQGVQAEPKDTKHGREPAGHEPLDSGGQELAQPPAALLQVPDTRRSPDLDPVLAGIDKRLQPVWDRSHPPGPGRVDVSLELSSTGAVLSAAITALEGSPALGRYVLDLIAAAGPFPEAGRHISDRLVVGCTFTVRTDEEERQPGREMGGARPKRRAGTLRQGG